ncbi:MAG: amidohydrolase [Fimbriimonadaceae bacterium]
MLATLVSFLVAPPADLVLEHATLWTNGRTIRDATIGIRGGLFVHVGRPRADLIGPNTKVVDAATKVVLPGIIDSHMHLMRGGIRLNSLILSGTKDRADFLQRVQDWAEKLQPGQWVIGSGWSSDGWPDKTQPTREWLDKVTGDHPAALTRMDGHSVLLNSKALQLMSITKEGPANPTGGSIDRDPATGEPTGLLREIAMGLLKLPPTSPDQIYEAFKMAVKMANSQGITAASEIGTILDFGAYRRYAQTEPTIRLALYPVATNWSTDVSMVQSFTGVPSWVEARGVKGYMDGTLGSRTAFMFAPFTKPLPDQTSPTGLPRPGFGDGTYAKGIKTFADAGLQVLFHSIGDRANSETLSLYEANASNLKELRFRVEHAQHLTSADILRFAKLGVIASMQPFHKADDGQYCEEVIGTERSRTSYAYKDLLKSGARLAFGSDWPVVTANPWLGIETAVTGRILTGSVWMPHQNISVDEALKAYTVGGAYAMGRERDLGQVAVGFRADFLIMNSSPFERKPVWNTMAPERVWVNGKEISVAKSGPAANGGAPDDCD